MVRFDTAQGSWSVGVEHTVEVRPVSAVRPLPSARPGVAGVIDREGTAVPVVHTLGDDGRHVLVLRAGGITIGMLVTEVTGVVKVPATAVGPAPAGQDAPFIGATVRHGDDLTFLVDVGELTRSLGGQP
jgi:chemotaxis signal transduction protein